MIRLQRFLSRFYQPLKALNFLEEYGISKDMIHYLNDNSEDSEVRQHNDSRTDDDVDI